MSDIRVMVWVLRVHVTAPEGAGDLLLTRRRRATDAWAITEPTGLVARRRLLRWRRDHPDVSLLADQPLTGFDEDRLPSSRTDVWTRNRSFTLAEALFVVGVTPKTMTLLLDVGDSLNL